MYCVFDGIILMPWLLDARKMISNDDNDICFTILVQTVMVSNVTPRFDMLVILTFALISSELSAISWLPFRRFSWIGFKK